MSDRDKGVASTANSAHAARAKATANTIAIIRSRLARKMVLPM